MRTRSTWNWIPCVAIAAVCCGACTVTSGKLIAVWANAPPPGTNPAHNASTQQRNLRDNIRMTPLQVTGARLHGDKCAGT